MMKPDRLVRIRLQTRVLPYIVGLLLLMQIIAPYQGWVMLLAGLGTAWGLGYIWVRSLGHNVNLFREMRFGWLQVGDVLEERFTLSNAGFFPALFTEVRDSASLPGYTANQVRSVGSYAERRWTVKTICSQRGLYELGPTRVIMGDPLGIFTVELQYQATTSLLITPPVVPLPAIQVAAGGRSGEGRPRPNSPDQTVSVGGVRDYRPGDALRWIHWPTSARLNGLFVRLFDGTPAGDWWILLDAFHDRVFGEGEQTTLEHGIILAASLVARGLESGLAVGLLANSRELSWLPPELGEMQRWEVFRSLALLETGSIPLQDILHRAGDEVKSQSSLIIITADGTGAWIEALLPLVWRGVAPTIILLDSVSYGGGLTADSAVTLLRDLGFTHYLVQSDFLDRPESRPGDLGQWEWRITATGKAIPVQQPEDQTWREFS